MSDIIAVQTFVCASCNQGWVIPANWAAPVMCDDCYRIKQEEQYGYDLDDIE